MMKALFLDDIRMPQQVYEYIKNNIYLSLEWIIVRNYEEFVQAIITDFPDVISFDHDLGKNDYIEIWEPVNNYEKQYEVSNFGRIRSLPRNTTSGKIINPIKTESGLWVSLRNSGNDTKQLIHRLVAKSFIENPENKPQINHIDGNRWNNFVGNLEWVTNSENVKHSHDYLNRVYTAYGENHKNSKTVSQYTKSGIYLNTFGSVNEASRQLNISFENIASCARGKRKSAGNFIWKYENNNITTPSKLKHILKKEKNYIDNFFIPTYFEKTGYECAKWLVEYCLDNDLDLPLCYVHSMNPVGKDNINNLLKNYNDSRISKATL